MSFDLHRRSTFCDRRCVPDVQKPRGVGRSHASRYLNPSKNSQGETLALRLLGSAVERRMRVKVYGGTPSHSDKSLCETCKHSTITRGPRLEDEIIRCEAQAVGTTFVTFVVTECTAYLDAALPSYPELFEKAWILR